MSSIYFEKIIKRENGDSYQICINASFSNKMDYKINAYYRLKNKRKWTPISRDIPDFQYRKLSLSDRREYYDNNLLRFFTADELYQARMELWESLKPEK